MEPISSWEAASRSATREFPSISRNTKVHYRVNRSPPLTPILSQTNPVHITPAYFSKISFNIIFPPTKRRRDNSASIETGYRPGLDFRYPTSYSMGSRGSFQKGKASGPEADHSSLSTAEVSKAPSVFVVWCLINWAQGQVYLFLTLPTSRSS
jgi:hypothetical protein